MTDRFSSRLLRQKIMARAGLFIIVASVLIGYYPSVKIGFLGDDWWFLGKAASLNLPQYLAFYFDPRAQIFWYRPLYGIILGIGYLLFGSLPDGYHLGQVALHAVNSLLLFAVLQQITQRWRLSFIAAVFYALLPVNNLAIFWIAVQDPLAMVFYLTAIWFWARYLKEQRYFFYGGAFAAFLLALLSKEASVFLPVTLFLVDQLLIAKKSTAFQLIRRYAPWIVGLLIYLVIEYQVQTVAYFPNRWGYGIGFHIVENLAHYLGLLIFPWRDTPLIIYAALASIGIIVLVFAVKTRNKIVFFLLLQILLTIAPALAFPTQFFQARYLYFASAVSAIAFAGSLEFLYQKFVGHTWSMICVVGIALSIVLANSVVTMVAANDQFEAARQMRVPLRDIYQQHPTYPQDTFLYFIEPPYPMIMRNLTGMFILRYGSNVSVWSNNAEWGGVDEDRFANLNQHQNSFIYYFDPSGKRHETPVVLSARSNSIPSMPVIFQPSIWLEGYEVTSTLVKRESDLILLLYWRSTAPIDQNYTVFVHLVNEKGETVVGDDAQPRGGQAPTTSWKTNKLVADPHILQITNEVPLGKYRLEIGLYNLSTMERLVIVDSSGNPISDRVVIEPFAVTETTP